MDKSVTDTVGENVVKPVEGSVTGAKQCGRQWPTVWKRV
jgi:hypothetical protein